MHNKDILMGDPRDVVVQYDGSGVAIPFPPPSSPYPGNTSPTDPNTGDVITPNDPNQDQEDRPDDNLPSSNSWIMYLGVGLLAYILLFKKK